jgi:hypothetical protein
MTSFVFKENIPTLSLHLFLLQFNRQSAKRTLLKEDKFQKSSAEKKKQATLLSNL